MTLAGLLLDGQHGGLERTALTDRTREGQPVSAALEVLARLPYPVADHERHTVRAVFGEVDRSVLMQLLQNRATSRPSILQLGGARVQRAERPTAGKTDQQDARRVHYRSPTANTTRLPLGESRKMSLVAALGR